MMQPEDAYAAWKKTHRDAAVPASFADNVIASLSSEAVFSLMPYRRLAIFLMTRAGKVAVVGLACAACLLRLIHVIAPFFVM